MSDRNSLNSFPALFLDRDGVLVEDVPYNGNPQKVVLRQGVCDVIRAAKKQGYWIVMVSNQSGIGRGKITVKDFFQVHQEMCLQLARQDCYLDHWEIATYIEGCDPSLPWSSSNLRKPECGMFINAKAHLNIDFSRSILIGDSASDLLAGSKAHVSKLFLIDDGNKNRFVDEQKKLAELNYNWEAVTDFSSILSFLNK